MTYIKFTDKSKANMVYDWIKDCDLIEREDFFWNTTLGEKVGILFWDDKDAMFIKLKFNIL